MNLLTFHKHFWLLLSKRTFQGLFKKRAHQQKTLGGTNDSPAHPDPEGLTVDLLILPMARLIVVAKSCCSSRYWGSWWLFVRAFQRSQTRRLMTVDRLLFWVLSLYQSMPWHQIKCYTKSMYDLKVCC